MELLVEIVFWIFKALVKGVQQSSPPSPNNPTAMQSARNTAQPSSGAKRQASAPGQRPATTTLSGTPARLAMSASDQKTAEVWEEYRKKQEALEAQFRAKAPQ